MTGVHVVNLRRYLARADVTVTDSFGRKIRVARNRGAYLDPAGAAPLVKAGQLEEVPELRNPPGGWQLPWSSDRREP